MNREPQFIVSSKGLWSSLLRIWLWKSYVKSILTALTFWSWIKCTQVKMEHLLWPGHLHIASPCFLFFSGLWAVWVVSLASWNFWQCSELCSLQFVFCLFCFLNKNGMWMWKNSPFPMVSLGKLRPVGKHSIGISRQDRLKGRYLCSALWPKRVTDIGYKSKFLFLLFASEAVWISYVSIQCQKLHYEIFRACPRIFLHGFGGYSFCCCFWVFLLHLTFLPCCQPSHDNYRTWSQFQSYCVCVCVFAHLCMQAHACVGNDKKGVEWRVYLSI